MATKSYTQRVWAGDTTIVAEARKRYAQSPQEGLMGLATALYSLRMHDMYAEELFELRHELAIQAAWDMSRQGEEGVAAIANRVEILSVYCEWISNRRELGESERKDFEAMATSLCDFGLRILPESEVPLHTQLFFRLMHIQLHLKWGMAPATVWQELHLVGLLAHSVRDPNQCARVFRKIGVLYRKSGQYILGMYWGTLACYVPGATAMTHGKSVAALFGVER